jgi:hypothetical protein
MVQKPLKGQPKGDRAFLTAKGNRFRTRIIRSDQRVEGSVNPNLSSAQVIPTDVTLVLTVAELDEKMEVVKIGDQFSIFAPHEIPLTRTQLAHPKFDLKRIVREAQETKIAEVETILINRRRMLVDADELGIDLGGTFNSTPVKKHLPPE